MSEINYYRLARLIFFLIYAALARLISCLSLPALHTPSSLLFYLSLCLLPSFPPILPSLPFSLPFFPCVTCLQFSLPSLPPCLTCLPPFTPLSHPSLSVSPPSLLVLPLLSLPPYLSLPHISTYTLLSHPFLSALPSSPSLPLTSAFHLSHPFALWTARGYSSASRGLLGEDGGAVPLALSFRPFECVKG